MTEMSKESLAAKPLKYATELGDDYFSIGFDLSSGTLTVSHMGVDVSRLPSSKTATDGPLTIDSGEIKINAVTVHVGHAQYSKYMIDEWIAENGLGNLTDIYIGGFFSCSSSTVVNGFFKDLGVMICEE